MARGLQTYSTGPLSRKLEIPAAFGFPAPVPGYWILDGRLDNGLMIRRAYPYEFVAGANKHVRI